MDCAEGGVGCLFVKHVIFGDELRERIGALRNLLTKLCATLGLNKPSSLFRTMVCCKAPRCDPRQLSEQTVGQVDVFPAQQPYDG